MVRVEVFRILHSEWAGQKRLWPRQTNLQSKLSNFFLSHTKFQARVAPPKLKIKIVAKIN